MLWPMSICSIYLLIYLSLVICLCTDWHFAHLMLGLPRLVQFNLKIRKRSRRKICMVQIQISTSTVPILDTLIQMVYIGLVFIDSHHGPCNAKWMSYHTRAASTEWTTVIWQSCDTCTMAYTTTTFTKYCVCRENLHFRGKIVVVLWLWLHLQKQSCGARLPSISPNFMKAIFCATFPGAA